MKDSVKSVVVITVICLVVAAALGLTNYFTAPVIEEGTEQRTQEALKEIIPEAEEFEAVSLDSYKDLPDTVTAIYKDKDGLGYIFQISTKGYDTGLVIMCAVSANDGTIIKTSTLSNNETPTIGGNKVINNEDYTSKYIDKDASTVDDGTDAVTGATVTSNAYKAAIKDALTAFSLVAIGEE